MKTFPELHEAITLLSLLFQVVIVLNVTNWICGKVMYNFTVPRTLLGFVGIPIAPLLHGTWEHLLINGLSFGFLSALLIFKSKYLFLSVVVLVGLFEGVIVWLLSPEQIPSFGASGIVFGLFSFVVLSAFKHYDVFSLLCGIAAIATHWQLFRIFRVEQGTGISNTSHFAGLIGGILVALIWG